MASFILLVRDLYHCQMPDCLLAGERFLERGVSWMSLGLLSVVIGRMDVGLLWLPGRLLAPVWLLPLLFVHHRVPF